MRYFFYVLTAITALVFFAFFFGDWDYNRGVMLGLFDREERANAEAGAIPLDDAKTYQVDTFGVFLKDVDGAVEMRHVGFMAETASPQYYPSTIVAPMFVARERGVPVRADIVSCYTMHRGLIDPARGADALEQRIFPNPVKLISVHAGVWNGEEFLLIGYAPDDTNGDGALSCADTSRLAHYSFANRVLTEFELIAGADDRISVTPINEDKFLVTLESGSRFGLLDVASKSWRSLDFDGLPSPVVFGGRFPDDEEEAGSGAESPKE